MASSASLILADRGRREDDTLRRPFRWPFDRAGDASVGARFVRVAISEANALGGRRVRIERLVVIVGTQFSVFSFGNIMQAASYPHITSNPSILSGIPIVEGTRTPVRSIAGYYNLGLTPDEILEALPHLTPSQLHAALTYYFDHREEIDADIAANSDTARWKALTDRTRPDA